MGGGYVSLDVRLARSLKEEPRRGAVTLTPDGALEPFFDRLSRHGGIDRACRFDLSSAVSAQSRLDKGTCFSNEGEALTSLAIVCDGLVLASRRLPDGLQQHLAIRAPGQILDHAGYVLEQAGVSTCALTDAVVVSVSRPTLFAVLKAHPALGRALNRELASDARIAEEWMVGMGRRSAYVRTAHLLCEVWTRLKEVGMAGPSDCPFPLNQSDLADTLGLSAVHTNRVLQQLRRQGLISLVRSRLEVHDWAGLAEAGDFDAGYLHAAQLS